MPNLPHAAPETRPQLDDLIAAARAGDAHAQSLLGDIYRVGDESTKQDYAEALRWYRLAAYQGHIDAIAQLGVLYQNGLGVERRIPTAAEFHVIAARAGDCESAARLHDYREALEGEALSGSMSAALSLAKMSDSGLGVAQDKAKMFAWLMWGGYKGTRDDDPDVREKMAAMREHHSATLADAVQDEAWKLFGAMWSPTAVVVDNRPRDAEGNLIHEALDVDPPTSGKGA